MELNVKVGVSNRHVHLTQEVYNLLFDHEPTIKSELSQPGMYAYNECVTIKSGDREINNVRILGPFRNYNQVEVSATDARLLKLNPPIRQSGDLSLINHSTKNHIKISDKKTQNNNMEEFVPEIIFLQRKIKKFLLSRHQSNQDIFYNKNYSDLNDNQNEEFNIIG